MNSGTGWASANARKRCSLALRRCSISFSSRDVDVEAADVGDPAVAVAQREADHHAPAVGLETGDVLLDHLGAPGLEHQPVVRGDHAVS